MRALQLQQLFTYLGLDSMAQSLQTVVDCATCKVVASPWWLHLVKASSMVVGSCHFPANQWCGCNRNRMGRALHQNCCPGLRKAASTCMQARCHILSLT